MDLVWLFLTLTDVLKETFGVLCILVVLIVVLAFSPLSLSFRELKQGRRGLLNERYSKSKATSEKYDAIVIGSGMGGLSCAASLSRFGKKVLVLEQHDVAGGGTHTFVLKGKTESFKFDSGLHYTVPQSAELIQLACGTRHKPIIFDKLGGDDGCFDKVVLGDPANEGFRIKHDQAHLDALRKMFPDEKDQQELDNFLRIATKVNAMIPVWIGTKILPKWARKIYEKLFLKTFYFYLAQTGEDVTRKLISNPKLAAILCGLWLDEGSPPNETTFMMTAALSVGFPKEGGAYPRGGTEEMASALVRAIETSGGKVLMRVRVQEIIVEGNTAKGVLLHDGTNVFADTVISACGYGNTFCKLVPKEAVPEGFVKYNPDGSRVLPDGLCNSPSWVMANVGIKGTPSELGIDCTNSWIQNCDEENGWDLFDGIKNFMDDPLNAKVMPMMVTFPSIKDRGFKTPDRVTCQLLVLVRAQWFEKWESENGKHPAGGEYETYKKQWEEKMISTLLKRYPAMEGKLDLVDVSTPLSIKYYLNKAGGGAVGLCANPERFFSEQLDMNTPIDGLWLTGEDSLLCGQPLAQLSGVITSWRIMGFSGTARFILGIVRLALSDLLGL